MGLLTEKWPDLSLAGTQFSVELSFSNDHILFMTCYNIWINQEVINAQRSAIFIQNIKHFNQEYLDTRCPLIKLCWHTMHSKLFQYFSNI